MVKHWKRAIHKFNNDENQDSTNNDSVLSTNSEEDWDSWADEVEQEEAKTEERRRRSGGSGQLEDQQQQELQQMEQQELVSSGDGGERELERGEAGDETSLGVQEKNRNVSCSALLKHSLALALCLFLSFLATYYIFINL